MNKRWIRGIILLLFLFLPLLLPADQSEGSRPRIGLVLSGGGARGFAHVGVLQWLEEHRIPVDVIAGTSMGGLVGGMYATGMTPDELRQMVATIDWTDLFRPNPAYNTLSFRRKEDRRSFPNSFELGLKGGFKFPPGVNPGHNIGLLLDRYTLSYSTISNFDALPTPFRCVATDMVKAKQVVLGQGSLATAMQATMAIPGVFYPVEIDGMILSDGGLLNNVPTDVAEQMGADVIIAVDIGTPLAKREALDTLGGILGQTISVTMNQSIENNLDQRLHPKLKVVIAPDLQKYTTFSFADYAKIMELGYQGSASQASLLEEFALDETAWQEHLRDRESRIRRPEDLPAPQFVKVQGTDDHAQKKIAGFLHGHTGQPIQTDALEKDLTTIWGRGRYAGLGYQSIEEQDKSGLLIRAREKGFAPPFLNLGLEINNTQTDVFDFNLKARITLMDLKQQGAEWRLDGSLGSEILIGAEYYKLLGNSRFFVAPRASYNRTKTGVFQEEKQLGEYQLDTNLVGIDLGCNFGNSSELRLGYEFGREEGSVRVGAPDLPEGSGKFSKALLRWTLDTTDNAVVPGHGVRLFSSSSWNFDVPIAETGVVDKEFAQAFVRMSAFIPFRKKNTITLIGEGGTTFDGNAPPLQKLKLGGFLRLSAANRDEFLGNHLVYAGAGYLRKLAQLPPLVGEKLTGGIWYETGSAYDDWDTAEFHHSISAGVIAETFLGPVLIGFAFGDEGRNNFFFAVGRIL